MDPMLEKLSPGSNGLDFGSGPGPTLSIMLEEGGFNMNIYDPIFHNDGSVLKKTYDFLTCTETVEHFCNPKVSWHLIFQLVRSGGFIGIMTQMYDGKIFSDWHYIRDHTHVEFYSKHTFRWLSRKYKAHLNLIGDSVALLQA
ncbi:MAG: class I SAM-dependent methyltransferase [Deltaproteobacteria bacterium]|nr:class I SAM-dependent methyltransferase [Deltaproteobacteria bacterium]